MHIRDDDALPIDITVLVYIRFFTLYGSNERNGSSLTKPRRSIEAMDTCFNDVINCNKRLLYLIRSVHWDYDSGGIPGDQMEVL